MKTSRIEAWLRRTANALGLDLTRHHPERSDTGRLATMLATHRIDFVIDVGANQGQFALGLRRAGYRGGILSFEPLRSAHDQLLQASRSDADWHVAERTAVGAGPGTVEMQVAGNSVSSSVLEMLPRHADAAPGSGVVATESAPVDALDHLALPYLRADARVFIKIDTQGYEDRVLDGASATLARAFGVQLELSLVPLYDGQLLHEVLTRRIQALGFRTWAIWPAFFDPLSGRMLQMDATFFREADER